MRTILLLSLLAMAMTTTACSRNKGVAFDGVVYKAKARAERSNRKDFTVTVQPVTAQGLAGAIAAARHEGIKHCIRYYGTSDIVWIVGPETPADQLRIDGNTLTFTGSCVDA
ncbi:hypothetical protein [Puniceibacterium sediminis]|uniref:Peptidase inhibitor I78 family protein n=1 Tax=Puniceibacterium sediminis TaxID=1608407 RepID=A0A238W7V6_9RHOB|nr:hypothetical protein [Puniceibacterium sediminis]SNR42491.1 hypothetical protein SAMN06265370_104230 [Puniceibacterium sediminis]